VNVIHDLVPLPMGILPQQQLPFPTVLRSEGLYFTPLQLHAVFKAVQLLQGNGNELLAIVSVEGVKVTVDCQEV
jgi:hypothetical protein